MKTILCGICNGLISASALDHTHYTCPDSSHKFEILDYHGQYEKYYLRKTVNGANYIGSFKKLDTLIERMSKTEEPWLSIYVTLYYKQITTKPEEMNKLLDRVIAMEPFL